MQEIIIPGSLGDIYGVLQLPERELSVPLVILPGQGHGFTGGARQAAMERKAAFFRAKA